MSPFITEVTALITEMLPVPWTYDDVERAMRQQTNRGQAMLQFLGKMEELGASLRDMEARQVMAHDFVCAECSKKESIQQLPNDEQKVMLQKKSKEDLIELAVGLMDTTARLQKKMVEGAEDHRALIMRLKEFTKLHELHVVRSNS